MSETQTQTRANANRVFDDGGLERFLSGRDEPAWLTARRREAGAAFAAKPWPTLRDEDWRRTDIRMLKLGAFGPPGAFEPTPDGIAELDRLAAPLRANTATTIEHLGGRIARAADGAALPRGVIFAELGASARTHSAIVERHLFTRAVDPLIDVFAALHAAYWTSGTLLYVPKGVRIEAPLGLVIAMNRQSNTDFHHTLVVLEEGAEATLVQEAQSAGEDPALHVGSVELVLGKGSKLTYVNIQNWNAATWHLSRDRAVLDREAMLQWTVGGLGSRLAKVNQETVLAGQGSRAQVNGVLFTNGRQNLTYLTRQDHAATNTRSDLLYKGGLLDASRLVWRGMIRVEPDAQKTDAYQKNDNLILSDAARADSIPGLEIEANDVRCTHGATAGRVDEEMLFYMQSRGLHRDEATRLVVEGFFANVYDRITLEPVRETLRLAVAAKLGIGR